MAEVITIARPYAKAIFELAQSGNAFKEWSQMLATAAQVVSDPQMRAMIGNPRISNQQLVDIIIGICGASATAQARSMIRLLAENHRLACLPQIAALYEELRAEAEKTVEAEVISAFEVGEAEQQKIKAALKKRLGREVQLTCRVDATLIGGAIIRANDLVIDGSVAGQLTRLENALSR